MSQSQSQDSQLCATCPSCTTEWLRLGRTFAVQPTLQSTGAQASVCRAFSSQGLNISTLWLHVPECDHLHGEKAFSKQTGTSQELVLLSQGEASDTTLSSRSGWQHPLSGAPSGLSPLMCSVPSAGAGSWPLAHWHHHWTVLGRISGPFYNHAAKCCYKLYLCAGSRLELGSFGAVHGFPHTAVSWRQGLQQLPTKRQPAEALCKSWQKQKPLEAKPPHQQWARHSQPMQLSDVPWSSLQEKVGSLGRAAFSAAHLCWLFQAPNPHGQMMCLFLKERSVQSLGRITKYTQM